MDTYISDYMKVGSKHRALDSLFGFIAAAKKEKTVMPLSSKGLSRTKLGFVIQQSQEIGNATISKNIIPNKGLGRRVLSASGLALGLVHKAILFKNQKYNYWRGAGKLQFQ